MSSKLLSIFAAVGIFSVLLFSGCGTNADLSLKFSSDSSTTYKLMNEVVQDYRYDRPNENKLTEQQTKTLVELEFTQSIQEIDTAGNAVAQITIKEFKVDLVVKDEPKLSFESRNEKDNSAPLAALLGKSYTIQINPNGQVKSLDVKGVLAAVKPAYEQSIVRGLFKPEAVAKLHQISALPESPEGTLAVNDQWSKVVPPFPKMFAAKSYKKTYTLADIDGDIATVQMVGSENVDPQEIPSSGMNPFAKMFDNKDDYTGMMTFDLTTGEVLTSEEILISTSLMQEMPENGDPEKGPDSLTMRYLNRIQLEKLN